MEKTNYPFSQSPIDVVIPSTPKDLDTIDLCIQGLRENVENIGRIVVLSEVRLTDKAEWFDERKFPFSRFDAAYEIFKDVEEANDYLTWRDRLFFNQILKLYAPLVIPNLSPNVLLIDSDTIFLNPVQFIDSSGAGLYNAPGGHPSAMHFEHMERLLPGLKQIQPGLSGIVFHMLFQRPVLEDLFSRIEKHHGVPTWKAICHTVDKSLVKGQCAIADYEIYFHFAFSRTDQVKIRQLKWLNIVDNLEILPELKRRGYHHVSCHDWARSKRELYEIAKKAR
ncbi:MAG TPA: hypothetical protein DCE71_08205 [Parachlamydiales bacterium]|nr:hypothetical protein [Parachlamydiales bacterium]